jgi:hypothetical protein
LPVFAKRAIESFEVGKAQLRDDLIERETGFLLLRHVALPGCRSYVDVCVVRAWRSLQRWIGRVTGPDQMRALIPFLYGAGSRVAFAIVRARMIRAASAQKRAA